MSRTPQDKQMLRGLRSVFMVLILTAGAVYAIAGRAFPPHGNPLVYSLATSWIISITIAMLSSRIFFRVNLRLFSLAPWEKEGEIYERTGIEAFRWVLFHSPLGWINPNFHWRGTRADCDRLLKEMNSGEAMHWLTFVASALLAIWQLFHGYAVYGYVLVLIRIPLDLYPIMVQRWNRSRVLRLLRRPARA